MFYVVHSVLYMILGSIGCTWVSETCFLDVIVCMQKPCTKLKWDVNLNCKNIEQPKVE